MLGLSSTERVGEGEVDPAWAEGRPIGFMRTRLRHGAKASLAPAHPRNHATTHAPCAPYRPIYLSGAEAGNVGVDLGEIAK